jgi:hypothetical protein
MIKFLAIVSSVLVCQTLHAQVYINKGPAFISSGKFNGGFTQRGVVGLYAYWNLNNVAINFINKEKIKIKHKINSRKDFFSKKVLKPLDLNSNALTFSYKDGNNEYRNWDFIGVKYGYCHGMTMVNRQFVYFADFKPNVEVPKKIKKSNYKYRKYFKDKIDAVMNSIPTEFPEFANLSELSDSYFREYLQRHVADQWGINTSQVSLYNKYRNWEPLNKTELEELNNNLESYLSAGFYPRLILGEPIYHNDNPHVVMIKSFTKEVTNDELGYCLKFTYFNVGIEDGGYLEHADECYGIGSYIIAPSDEELYFKNIFTNSTKF